MALYDTIGTNYNTTRKADPYIASKIYDLLSPAPSGIYLDIGCGTGNYLHALSNRGLQFYGVDPSETMLRVARQRNPDAIFINSTSDSISLPDRFFDGAIAVLTIHHWANLLKGLREVNRLLKPGAPMVVFSFTPEQMKGYWLFHYFPQMIEKAMQLIPSLNDMEKLLMSAGFSHIATELYYVREDLEDNFMYSNKYKPENYLRPEVRNNASAFSALATKEETENGVAMLATDIKTGKINDIMVEYHNNIGDYLFIKATK